MALLNSLVVAGPSRFLGTAYFQGVTISGSATFASLSTTGNMTVGGTLGVTGATTLSSTLGVTGATTFNGAITANVSAFFKGGIEIIHSTPYIDFHYQNSSNDWTSRIIENTSGTLTVSTNLTVSNTLSAPNITATNISTTNIRWTKAEEITVADLGGTFIVAPTIYFTENTSSNPNATKVTISAISGKTVTMTIVCDAINSDTLGGHTWTQYSKVKLSGAIGGCVLGSSDGYLSAKLNTTAKTANVVATIENASKLTVGTTYNGSNVQNLAMMMYAVGNGSQQNTLKVGMILTSYGDNYRSYLDIYGGVTSNDSVTRIGNLGGLTYKGSQLENQWGLLTTNGYFTGVVNAEGGTIGGFTIGSTTLSNGTFASSGGVYMSTGKAATASQTIGGSPGSLTWAFTSGATFGVTTAGALYATSGKIGGWTIGATTLSSGTMAADNSIYLLTADQSSNTTVGNKALSTWRLTVGNKFGIDKNGNVYGSAVTLGNPSGYHAVMNSSSFDVYNNTTSLASFGATATIGNMRSGVGFQISATGNDAGMKFNHNGTQVFFVGVNSRYESTTANSSWYTISSSSTTTTINGQVYCYVCDVPSGTTIVGVKGKDPDGTKDGMEQAVTDYSDEKFLKWTVSSNKFYVYTAVMDYDWDSWSQDVQYVYLAQSSTAITEPYSVLGTSNYSSDINPGKYSLAQGNCCQATGRCSVALGELSTASGPCSATIGYRNTASGETSIAMGYMNVVSGKYSAAIGMYNTVYGAFSTAIGYCNDVSGKYSTAMGRQTIASGDDSTATGAYSVASGEASTAMGDTSVASGTYSIAMGGGGTKASGYCSVAIGFGAIASGFTSTAIGNSTKALEQSSTAIGSSTTASKSYSTAMGSGTTASGYSSTAIGYYTTASGDFSTASGRQTTASGSYSTAMGYQTTASSYYSTAMGYQTTASSYYSTAMGRETIASGYYSTAMGYQTTASGDNSVAMGRCTIATHMGNVVIGKYNAATRSGSGTTASPYTYSDVGDYAFIIGNGTGDVTNQRSNALTVGWDGELIANGQSFRNVSKIINKTTNVTSLTNTTCRWRYRQFSNGYIDGYGIISATWSHYIVFSSFYGYYCTVQLPAKFVVDGVTATVSWNIGNAIGISAGVKGARTTEMNIYALSSASGAQAIIAMIHIKGRIAAPWTGFGIKAVNSSVTWTNDHTTIDGVTYIMVVDDDDRITSFTTSGTSTASTTAFKLYDHSVMSDLRIPNGTYHFECTPSGGSSTTYCVGIQMHNSSTNTDSTIYDTGSGCTFTQSDTEYVNTIYCKFKSGLNTSGKTWRPKLIKET